MAWIDQRSYFGPDRRQRKSGFRLLERRGKDAAQDPPSLSAAGRRLSLWAFDAERPDKAGALVAPLNGMALLLRHNKIVGLATRLERVAARLNNNETGTELADEMRAIAERLAAGARPD
jgi:hypothetical protein